MWSELKKLLFTEVYEIQLNGISIFACLSASIYGVAWLLTQVVDVFK